MKDKQQLVIILPESMADMPVRIARGSSRELVLKLSPRDEVPVRCLKP